MGVVATLTTYGKKSAVCILVGSDEKQVRKMVSDRIKLVLAKNVEVSWNTDTLAEVRMFKGMDYDDQIPEHSEFLTTYVRTVTSKGVIDSNVIRKRNPLFANNPECPMCYKQVTKLVQVTLVNKAKTSKMVCIKCRQRVDKVRKIVEAMGSVV